MKIVSGGQSGVDRAALDVAIECGIAYGGWCPRGGWAEDMTAPPGVLVKYPLLKETPLADPAQRTEWNVRDADATLIVVGAGGVSVSKGTTLARELAEKFGKPLLMVDLGTPDAAALAAAWIKSLGPDVTLGIGGPRESEAPGIYGRAKTFIDAVLGEIGL